MSKLESRIMWGVVFGVIVYALFGLWFDARALFDHLTSFPLLVFVGALGLATANYLVRFGKWHYYVRRLGFDVGVGESLNVFAAGLVMSITPGKIGEVLKSVLLRRSHGISVAASAPIVVAERLTDLFGLFVLAGFGIAVFDYGRWAFAATLGVLVVVIIVLQRPPLVLRLLDLLEAVPFVGRFRPELEEAYGSMRSLVSFRALVIATLLSAMSWSMEALAFWWILETLTGTSVSLNLASFIFAMTTILGAISFLPGGLGVTEGSMIGVLLLFGVFASESMATAATYLIRLATLWFGVAVGFAGLMVFRFRYGTPTTGTDTDSDSPTSEPWE